jgi:phage gp29-like protein
MTKKQRRKKKLSLNSQTKEPKTLLRPTVVPTAGKNEAVTGVTIKQVKEMLHSEDLTQVVKLFTLMTQRDLQLAGALQTRRDQLQSLSYKIEGNKEAVKFATSYLESIKFNLLLQDLSSALEYGFSVLDLQWSVKELDSKSYFVPTRLKLLSARYFSFDDKKQSDLEALYFKVKDKKKYLSSYDARKMLLHLHQTDTEHITRYSPLYKSAWFVALKHKVIASNMQWFDALGIPPLIINQDTADEKELESVLYQALSLRSNAVGIFPKGVDAQLLGSGGMGKADFLSFIQYIDDQVSFFITGQTLATTGGAGGSYAQAKIHADRLSEKQSFDAKLIGATITELLNTVVSVNFANAPTLKFSFVLKEHKDLKESSEVIKNLEASGFEVPAEHVEREFGIKGIKRKDALTQANNTTFLVEKNVQSKKLPLDKTSEQIEKLNLNAVEEQLNERLIKVLNKAKSFEEAYEMLASNDTVDTEALEKLLAQYIANAQMQGFDDGKN